MFYGISQLTFTHVKIITKFNFWLEQLILSCGRAFLIKSYIFH